MGNVGGARRQVNFNEITFELLWNEKLPAAVAAPGRRLINLLVSVMNSINAIGPFATDSRPEIRKM